MRYTILGAMNKSEGLNGFLKWLFFGGQGIIAENRRNAQRKIITHTHLVANLVICHNVVHLTKILHQLMEEGQHINPEALTVT